jgi:hypothetical protein
MPDRVECTPSPVAPPDAPQPPALPPILDPAAWEDFPVFRETFLAFFTEPPYNAALRIFGRLLHELVLEYYEPHSPISDTLRAISPP